MATVSQSKCPFATAMKEDLSHTQNSPTSRQSLVHQVPGPEPLPQGNAPPLQGGGLTGKGRPFIERNVSHVFDGSDPVALLKVLMPLKGAVGAGMLLAGLLCTFLPAFVTIALAACLLLPPLIKTALQASAVLPIPGAADIRKGAMTDTMEGEFCVFILGARSNTAWKLGPGFKTVGENFVKIIQELERLPAECGYLGGENYVTTNPQRSSHVTTIMYWKSYDHMLRYTHNRKLAHTSAMKAVVDAVYKSPDIGIWHEAYVVKPGQHESIYVNCPPLGLGAAAGLIPANGPHKTSKGRMLQNRVPAADSKASRVQG